MKVEVVFLMNSFDSSGKWSLFLTMSGKEGGR
jgi:hypothetical protein